MVSRSPGVQGGLGRLDKRLPFFSVWYIFFAFQETYGRRARKLSLERSPPLK